MKPAYFALGWLRSTNIIAISRKNEFDRWRTLSMGLPSRGGYRVRPISSFSLHQNSENDINMTLTIDLTFFHRNRYPSDIQWTRHININAHPQHYITNAISYLSGGFTKSLTIIAQSLTHMTSNSNSGIGFWGAFQSNAGDNKLKANWTFHRKGLSENGNLLLRDNHRKCAYRKLPSSLFNSFKSISKPKC